MTASIKEREDKYVTVKTTSKTKKLSLKTRNNWNQRRKHWKRKRNEIRAPRETERYLDRDALMDKEYRLAERAQELRAKQVIAETASKLADKTRRA